MTAAATPLIEERFTLEEWRRILLDPTDRDAYQRTRLGAVVARYLAWKRLGASTRTLVIYEGYLARLCIRFADQGIDPGPAKVTPQMLVDALADYQPGSWKIVRTTYCDFFAWCEEEGLVNRSPGRRLPKPKPPALKVYDVFNATEQTQLLMAADQFPLPWIQRARALAFMELGVRSSEARGIRLGDFDLDPTSRVVVVRGKGDKERIVPLSDPLWRAMVTFSNRPIPRVREDGGHVDRTPFLDDYLFFPWGVSKARQVTWTNPAKQLADRAMREWWLRIVRASGVRYRSLHMNRHTTGTELATAEVDVLAIGDWLGHASPDTTKIYVHNSRARLQRAAERRDAYRKSQG